MSAWDYSLLWKEALNQIQKEVGEQEFSMWFNLEYIESTETIITVSVPSSFYKDQVKQKYQNFIEDKLFELVGKKLAIDFAITQKKANDQKTTAKKESSDIKIPDSFKAQQDAPKKVHTKHPQLRSDYTFDNFVVGDNNSFAANAAQAISKNVGSVYNPFLIYGGVGLGKTHLMQSIGNSIWVSNDKAKIICITGEEFTNEFIQSIHDKNPIAFKNKYRYADVLLIDDIHFLQDKPGIQEELFYTFNALYDNHKQMVFTCDRPVSELKSLSDRLRSRFERGLNIDLQPPNYETRFAILKHKVEAKSYFIPDEVIDIIAKNITSNVRDLEAALLKIFAYAELVKQEITLEVAQAQLKDIFTQPKQGNVTMDVIIKTVAEYFNLSNNEMKGKKKTKAVAFPRQVAMYITRDITEYSTTEVGIEFGGRDHTTVMHACQKIEEKLKSDPVLTATIQKLKRQIKEQSTKN